MGGGNPSERTLRSNLFSMPEQRARPLGGPLLKGPPEPPPGARAGAQKVLEQTHCEGPRVTCTSPSHQDPESRMREGTCLTASTQGGSLCPGLLRLAGASALKQCQCQDSCLPVKHQLMTDITEMVVDPAPPETQPFPGSGFSLSKLWQMGGS